MNAFEKWWHEKCDADFSYPNESSFIRRIAKEAWNEALDAAAERCESVCHKHMNRPSISAEYISEAADECKDEVRKLKSL